ncbi:MAG: tetratricopeptide repeat protein, partial [Acidobacteria bacterium]|nr:tetratricopeptide repeat protein [Acidobacteriota bacterium]
MATVAQESAQPLSKSQIVDLLLADVASRRVAILAGQRGINFEPTNEDLETLRRAGADEDLLTALRKAKRFFPEEIQLQAFQTQAKQLVEQGSYAEAEKQYVSALFLAPKDGGLNWALGDVQAKQKKWSQAVASYRKAVERDPNNAEWHCDLGSALRETGDAAGALEQFKTAARLAPNQPRPYEEVGQMISQRRDWAQALVAYRVLAKMKPDSPKVHS